jgi:hypothetical protein
MLYQKIMNEQWLKYDVDEETRQRIVEMKAIWETNAYNKGFDHGKHEGFIQGYKAVTYHDRTSE